MAFSIQGKMSHSFMGLTQSIDSAMIRLTRAVGCRHMRPTPTNTRLLNLPIERNVVYPVRPVTKKWISSQRKQPFKENISYNLLWLCVIVRAVLPSKPPFCNHPK